MFACFFASRRYSSVPATLLLLLISLAESAAFSAEYSLPERVSVMPIAFVPNDQPRPTTEQNATFLKHLMWSQKRYSELLDGDTFEIAKNTVEVVAGRRSLEEYRNAPGRGAEELVSELLDHFNVNRFQNPYVFCIMFMNARDSFPEGGGRTINGGINTGGGMLHISSGELVRNERYQATLQHELGHAFGLPHVNVYGYDMKSNDSLMSYNPAHFTRRFEPSRTPGRLIPEDRRALAMNDRVFADTEFDPQRHIPTGYSISSRIVPLGPMNLPRHPDFYPSVSTTAGEDVRSKVVNIVRERIKPSVGPGITYDPSTMWHSKPLADGVAVLEIEFPVAVSLSGLAIHSQHSGLDHHATAMKLELLDDSDAGRGVSGSGSVRTVASQPLTSFDEVVRFAPASGKKWQLTLTAGPSRILVIRGLRFFDGQTEILPHMVPYLADAATGTSPPTSETLAQTSSSTLKKSPEGTQFENNTGDDSGSGSTSKRPEPKQTSLDDAKKTVREQFRSDYSKARRVEQKAALAQTLLDSSGDANDDAVRFMILKEAALAAAQGGETELAMLALQRIDEQFDVNLLPMKVEVLASFTPPKTADDATALLARYRELAQEAVAAEDYETAVAALQSAADDLRRPEFRPLRDLALAERQQFMTVRDAFKAARPARDKLQENPDDPTASLAWGRFVCFYMQDVDAGLKLFANASDHVWKPIAEAEAKSDKQSSDWLQLGDAWFAAASREKDPARAIALDRADLAWLTALDVASDLGKQSVATSLDVRFTKLFGSSLAVTNGSQLGATIPRTERMSPGEEFTVEFWVSTQSTRGTLLSKCHNAGDASLIAHLDGGSPQLGIKRGGGEGGSGAGAPINDGLWHHIAVVKKGDEVSMYVDGRRGARINNDGGLGSRSPWKFGCSYGRPPCAARFGGIRISNVARYQADFAPKKVFLRDSNTMF